MSVTIQQIAEAAGVSRGTVDRALNHRGRISPEVESRIREIAEQLGYKHKARKRGENKKWKIGIVTQLAKSSFMLEINRGIHTAKKEWEDRGIELLIEERESVDKEEQLDAIERLVGKGIHALAIMPIECDEVRDRLNSLIAEKKMPVVTFNSDIVGTKRLCFVGMDNHRSGQAAAGLMGMLTGGSGKVLIITGHFNSALNNQRVDGFVKEIKQICPGLEIAGVQGSFNEAEEVERIRVRTLLQESMGFSWYPEGRKGLAVLLKSWDVRNVLLWLSMTRRPGMKRWYRRGWWTFSSIRMVLNKDTARLSCWPIICKKANSQRKNSCIRISRLKHVIIYDLAKKWG